MRNMNCRNVRPEIEEVASDGLLSSSANDHMKNCLECRTFFEDRLKLREMLSSLGAVSAPDDFDFRLRARLANERRGGAQPFVMRNVFGFRSAAFATILLLIGAAFLFIRFSEPSVSSLSAKDTKPSSTTIVKPGDEQPGNRGQSESATQVAVGPQTDKPRVGEANLNSAPVREQRGEKRRAGLREEVASVRDNPRLKTRDLSSTAATVLRPRDAMAVNGSSVFPIGASFQSLKVSLDDGRGSSRTISLPSISFGSQRVLAQGTSPLLASARSAW